ncbi:MAG: type II toxin-antitoxin system RelE/ParE family toxin [Hyphomonadaceae bacterium]|nr:type II toxin-antitoxin system RelE/ParE family toxin [Hyphomonadaceae bacterium]
MRVHWRSSALADLGRIHEWLSTLPDADPDRTICRIEDAANLLGVRDTGRPSRATGRREKSVPNAPYVIVFAVEGKRLEIIAVFHMNEER